MFNNTDPAANEEYDTPFGKLWIYKTNPYGFRRLKLENGTISEKYDCDYTTPAAARTAKDKLIAELNITTRKNKDAEEKLRGSEERSGTAVRERKRSK